MNYFLLKNIRIYNLPCQNTNRIPKSGIDEFAYDWNYYCYCVYGRWNKRVNIVKNTIFLNIQTMWGCDVYNGIRNEQNAMQNLVTVVVCAYLMSCWTYCNCLELGRVGGNQWIEVNTASGHCGGEKYVGGWTELALPWYDRFSSGIWKVTCHIYTSMYSLFLHFCN